MRRAMPLIDPFQRQVEDLRISITDRCNFRCTYCMPEEGMRWLDRSELLSYEEQTRVAGVCVERFGFTFAAFESDLASRIGARPATSRSPSGR